MQGAWSHLGPLRWTPYVNKEVKVTAGKDEVFGGWLLTVDPVTASLVLVQLRSVGGASVQVVMGQAVQQVEVLQEADPGTARRLHSLFPPPGPGAMEPGERVRRRCRVRRWLEKNRIPVEEEGEELKVAGVLTIATPYGPDDCSGGNEIILDRIQKLLRQLDTSCC
ncbi:gem-associated protein 6 [Nerophis ophidion]|uniref:gem-associated protein 6 n=1 Tax=Nerophis ophidion TaxID=159077 RepID=UPI002AE09D6E|nr:gem-associated protein 6 [Nerophis ophidion]